MHTKDPIKDPTPKWYVGYILSTLIKTQRFSIMLRTLIKTKHTYVDTKRYEP